MAKSAGSSSIRVAPNKSREIWFEGRSLGQTDPKMEFRSLRGLKPHPDCARTRAPRGFVAGIAEALRLFPYPPPIVIDEKNRVVGGLNVFRAAKRAGLRVIPVLRAGYSRRPA